MNRFIGSFALSTCCVALPFVLVLTIIAPCARAQHAEPFTEFVRDDAAREAMIEIDAGRPAGFTLPPTLFGTFTENIWDAVYGGVWAQILHNPSFEPDYLSLQNMNDAGRYGRLVTDPSFGSGYVRVEPLTEETEEAARNRFVRSSSMGLPLPWEALRPTGMRYEPRDGDAANSYRSMLLMGLANAEVGVRQGVYLPVHRTLRYTGSLWVKLVSGDSRPTSGRLPLVTVSVRRRDRPEEVIAQTTIHAGRLNSSQTPGAPTPEEWSRREFTLDIPANRIAPLERVDFCISVDDEQRVLIDNVLLWPSDHVEGFDPEIIALARALRTPLLRFGGNFVSGYHWQDGVGDPERRRTILNQAWSLPEYNHFGTDEFIRLCRLIGAEPQISVNAGSGTAEEAAAWVEYCNGRATTRYGAMRAANGHAEPYNVRLWEIGNELWGDFQIGWQTPQSNARRYLQFTEAMRRVDPNIRFIATGADIDFFREWNGELIRQAGERLDLISTHLVIGMQPGEQRRANADDAFTHAADFAVPVGVGRGLDAMRAQIESDSRTRGRVRLAFTEWQFWSPRPNDPRFTNLGGAINSAAFFNMLARRADFVPISNMSNLVQFAGIHRQRGRTFVTPSYYVLQLYSDTVNFRPLHLTLRAPGYDVREGNRRVPEILNVPYVDALAVLSPDNRTLRVYLVNRNHTSEIPASINTRGFEVSRSAIVDRVSADRFDRANTPENPVRVPIIDQYIHNASNILRITLPAHSFTVVRLERR